jgi:hypothetical protein
MPVVYPGATLTPHVREFLPEWVAYRGGPLGSAALIATAEHSRPEVAEARGWRRSHDDPTTMATSIDLRRVLGAGHD